MFFNVNRSPTHRAKTLKTVSFRFKVTFPRGHYVLRWFHLNSFRNQRQSDDETEM